MKMHTQLGGKFSTEDNGIFDLRKKLMDAGVVVEFPFSDRIVGDHNGIPTTFIPTKEKSFYHIELDFFEAIRRNPLHVVHNKFKDNLGYIGVSAAIEMAFAILHNKPIILLYKPNYSEKIPQSIQDLLTLNTQAFSVCGLDKIGPHEIQSCIEEIVKRTPVYTYPDIENEINIFKTIADLFESYKSNI